MYATAHLDLVHETVAQQLRSAARAAAAPVAEAPITPARIRTWGPRASRRSDHVVLADVIRIPAPRETHPASGSPARSAVVPLDA